MSDRHSIMSDYIDDLRHEAAEELEWACEDENCVKTWFIPAAETHDRAGFLHEVPECPTCGLPMEETGEYL